MASHWRMTVDAAKFNTIRLILFLRTLIGVATKWYIELPRGAYGTFSQMVLVFLNHFQLSVHYDASLELLSNLCQDTSSHIPDHKQEWRRWKRLIKTSIPSNFILEWFLKYFHPPISKDVATSRVTIEEEEIIKSQQLDLIYSKSGMLYHILPDAPSSTYDPRKKSRPHVDDIVGSNNVKSVDLVTIHLKYLSLNQSTRGPTSSVSSNPTKSTDVHSVQSSTNLNGNQQPGGNKKKICNNNCKGGKNNNKPKDNGNNEKTNNNVGEGKKERNNVKFPYKICKNDHLTHLFTNIVKDVRLLSIPLVVLMNPFPHNQHMASSSSNVGNATSGSQNPS
jgi:hypothetical protein